MKLIRIVLLFAYYNNIIINTILTNKETYNILFDIRRVV